PVWPQSLPCLLPASRQCATVPTGANSFPLPQRALLRPDHPGISSIPRASHHDILPPPRENPISGPRETSLSAPQCTPGRSRKSLPPGSPPSRWLDAPAQTGLHSLDRCNLDLLLPQSPNTPSPISG